MDKNYVINCPVCYSEHLEFDEAKKIYNCLNCKTIIEKNEYQNDKYFVNLSIAETERQSGDFDKATGIYNDMLREYSNNKNVDLKPMYWGKYLCDERIVFRKTGNTEKDITLPNFYEVLPDRSTNYNKVLSLCNTNDELNVYEEQYNKIINVKNTYRNLFDTLEPFDIFISFKASKDIETGQMIYNLLSNKYNVFFSPVSLYNMKPNSEYTSNILYALKTAKILLLICSDNEYLNSSGWVRDEWKNFLRQMSYDNSKYIIPFIVGDFLHQDLPSDLLSMQTAYNAEDLDSLIGSILKQGKPITKPKVVTAKPQPKKIVDETKSDLSNFLYRKENDEIVFLGLRDDNIENLVIPKYIDNCPVTSIYKLAFYTFKTLKTVSLPRTLKHIGPFAFQECINIEKVTFEEGCQLESIGKSAFDDCRKLEIINLPDSVSKIDEGAFSYCVSLTSFNIPKNLTEIPKFAFYRSEKLETITINSNLTLIGGFSFCETNITDFIIPKTVTVIENNVFDKCKNLKYMVIPENVTKINFKTFYYCENLESVIIHKNVTDIGDWAFCGCKNLTITFERKKPSLFDKSLHLGKEWDRFTKKIVWKK